MIRSVENPVIEHDSSLQIGFRAQKQKMVHNPQSENTARAEHTVHKERNV